MKREVRRGVFETNSSSVHSLTMCSGEEYKKWENGEVLYWEEENYSRELLSDMERIVQLSIEKSNDKSNDK